MNADWVVAHIGAPSFAKTVDPSDHLRLDAQSHDAVAEDEPLDINRLAWSEAQLRAARAGVPPRSTLAPNTSAALP